MSAVTVPTGRVLFSEQQGTKQISCVVSSMRQAGPLYPQLLTYRCGAANRRFGPFASFRTAEKPRTFSPSLPNVRVIFLRIEAVGDESASTSFSPKLLHRSEPPSSLHRKPQAKLVRHDSKIWRGHGQVDVEVGAHSENR